MASAIADAVAYTIEKWKKLLYFYSLTGAQFIIDRYLAG
jgi:hypothetical protein